MKVKWGDEATFLEINLDLKGRWHYIYDRKWDRTIDPSKVLRATGLTKEDFISIYDDIKKELRKLNIIK